MICISKCINFSFVTKVTKNARRKGSARPSYTFRASHSLSVMFCCLRSRCFSIDHYTRTGVVLLPRAAKVPKKARRVGLSALRHQSESHSLFAMTSFCARNESTANRHRKGTYAVPLHSSRGTVPPCTFLSCSTGDFFPQQKFLPQFVRDVLGLCFPVLWVGIIPADRI